MHLILCGLDELDLLAGLLLEGGDDLRDRRVLLGVEPLLPPDDEVGGPGAERRQDERYGAQSGEAGRLIRRKVGSRSDRKRALDRTKAAKSRGCPPTVERIQLERVSSSGGVLVPVVHGRAPRAWRQAFPYGWRREARGWGLWAHRGGLAAVTVVMARRSFATCAGCRPGARSCGRCGPGDRGGHR